MKEIILGKTAPRLIGNVRVNETVFEKVSKIAKDNKVSKAEVVRSIIESFIDECNFK